MKKEQNKSFSFGSSGSPGLGGLGGFQGGNHNRGIIKADPNYHENQIKRVKEWLLKTKGIK